MLGQTAVQLQGACSDSCTLMPYTAHERANTAGSHRFAVSLGVVAAVCTLLGVAALVPQQTATSEIAHVTAPSVHLQPVAHSGLSVAQPPPTNVKSMGTRPLNIPPQIEGMACYCKTTMRRGLAQQ